MRREEKALVISNLVLLLVIFGVAGVASVAVMGLTHNLNRQQTVTWGAGRHQRRLKNMAARSIVLEKKKKKVLMLHSKESREG